MERKIICSKCAYEWISNSKMIYVTCPNCHKSIKTDLQFNADLIDSKPKVEYDGGLDTNPIRPIDTLEVYESSTLDAHDLGVIKDE
jgi:hypothetical protein